MSVCSEVSISGRVLPCTIVNIVYGVHKHVRVCKVVDVCDVSIQCPYTDVIVFVMYMTRAVTFTLCIVLHMAIQYPYMDMIFPVVYMYCI